MRRELVILVSFGFDLLAVFDVLCYLWAFVLRELGWISYHSHPNWHWYGPPLRAGDSESLPTLTRANRRGICPNSRRGGRTLREKALMMGQQTRECWKRMAASYWLPVIIYLKIYVISRRWRMCFHDVFHFVRQWKIEYGEGWQIESNDVGFFASPCRFSWPFMMGQQNRTHSTRGDHAFARGDSRFYTGRATKNPSDLYHWESTKLSLY